MREVIYAKQLGLKLVTSSDFMCKNVKLIVLFLKLTNSLSMKLKKGVSTSRTIFWRKYARPLKFGLEFPGCVKLRNCKARLLSF